MDPAPNNPMAERPFGLLSPHGGLETLVEQRPTDGHFPVAAKCFHQPPPSNNPPLPPLTASSSGAPVFPTRQPKCGSLSAGLGHAGQQPPSFSYHTGVPFQHAGGQALAGQTLPSISDRLLQCSRLINQLVEQQQFLQALFATAASPQSAMAAPPSSTSFQPQQLFEVRTSTRPEQAPSSPTESCEAHRHGPMCARNRADSEQGVHQDGGKASQQIQQGRKCNNSAEPKRQQCDVEPLEAQRLPGESSCDVNVGSTKHQGIVLASMEPAKRPGCDGVDDDGRCRIAESSASAAQWTTVSAANQKDQQCAASCAIDAVVLDWWKQISTLVPVDRSVYQQVASSFCRNTNTHTRKPSVWTPQMIVLSSSSSNADGGLNQVKSRRSSTSLRRGHLLQRSSLTFYMQFHARNITLIIDLEVLQDAAVDDQRRLGAIRICSLFSAMKSAIPVQPGTANFKGEML
ncbi:hypothetical protein quinque_003734 [Culex quinquefasciatus]